MQPTLKPIAEMACGYFSIVFINSTSSIWGGSEEILERIIAIEDMSELVRRREDVEEDE